MAREYDAFVDSIESENTAKIARSMSYIGEHDYDCVTPTMIDAVVLDMKPKSMKYITTTLYIMSLYAVHLGNKDMEYMIRGADRKLLWRMAKEYVGRGLTPLQLYVSGIMSRLSKRLDDIGVTLEDAFSDNNKNRSVSRIIRDELDYSGYDIEVRNFREIIKSHIDTFT